MLCPLSGRDPSDGPLTLIEHDDLEPVSSEMASEIISYGGCSLNLDELTSILSKALNFTLLLREMEWMDQGLRFHLDEGIFTWEDGAVLGVGYFDDSSDYKPVQVDGRYRSGLGVECKRLGDWTGYGYFHSILGEDREKTSDALTICTTDRGWPFFVLRPCLEYLRAWLDPHLPPRIAFKDSAPTMSLEGELYEILNTRIEERDRGGCIPSFDYDSIPDTFENDQFRFRNARRGSRHVARAITQGLRDEALLPALYADFRCWQTMRPDIWPSPGIYSPSPLYTRYHNPNPNLITDSFRTLPTELFFEILHYLAIPDILVLSSVSHGLRGHITEMSFLNQVIKNAVLSGTEFWILPVSAVRSREKERCWETALKWLPLSSQPSGDSASPFLSPDFPYPQFLHACYASDSMRNRQRLWKIVKQFDVLWRDYRLNGWERDNVLTFEPYIPPISQVI